VKEAPHELARDSGEGELEGGVLVHRVVSTLVGEGTDPAALASGDLVRTDDPGRVAGAGGGDGVVVGDVEPVAQANLRTLVRHRLCHGLAQLPSSPLTFAEAPWAFNAPPQAASQAALRPLSLARWEHGWDSWETFFRFTGCNPQPANGPGAPEAPLVPGTCGPRMPANEARPTLGT
jgi:hypothetical protein